MKLASFVIEGRRTFGCVRDGELIDVPGVWPDGPGDLLELIRSGADALDRVADVARAAPAACSLDEATLLAPITEPPKVLALAGNYVKHIKEVRLGTGLSDRPGQDTTPRPFIMPPTVVADPGAEIAWPPTSREIDYEVELAVVVGRRAKCVSPGQATECVFGYTIANDVSARSATFAEARSERPWDEFYDWLNGKWADGFCPTGPWIVTPDELGDPRTLRLTTHVNGEPRQDAHTDEMIFDVFEIVSFLSHLMTLTPGDVICTGTPSGVGAADGRFLEPGNEIVCRIDRIGELRNTLGRRPETFYAPCRDRHGG